MNFSNVAEMSKVCEIKGVRNGKPQILNQYGKPLTPNVEPRNASYWQPSSTVDVDAGNALSIDSVLSCVRVLAESMAVLPLHIYERKPDGTTTKATKEKIYNLLRWQPNPDMTSYELREWMMVDCLLRGTGAAQVLRNNKGEVLELWPLEAKKLKPFRGAKDGLKPANKDRNKLFYLYGSKDDGIIFDADEVLKIDSFTNGGLLGESLVSLSKEALGSAKAADEYAGEYFANASSPQGAYCFPNGVGSDEEFERLKKSLAESKKGKGNRHSVTLLERGEFKPFQINHAEAQLLESRKYYRSTIAGLFRVPAHLIGDLEKATFSNIEHQDLGFVKHTLRPWAVKWEQRIHMTLIPDTQKETHFAKHNFNDLLRGDLPSRVQAYSTGVQNGIWSPNEIRSFEDMNPYAEGDQYIVNGSMQPMKNVGQFYEPKEPQE